MSLETQRRSPYQGLIPYDEADTRYFFGREKETRLIIANLFAAPLTLLYGASGVGKSSVLRAGVVHQLRPRDDLLVVVFNTWQSDPLGGLKAAVAEIAGRNATESVPLASDSQSLAEYLTGCAVRLDRHLMIILDQFEEYFLYQPQDDAFSIEFPKAVTQVDAPISFLISIREDTLAKLDRFEGRIPGLFDNYLRIEHLDQEAARAAIEKPIAEYNEQYKPVPQFDIEDALVSEVLEQVKTGQLVLGSAGRGIVKKEAAETQIETPYLQLVMTRLWDDELHAASRVLRLETLNCLGGAERIVRTHLDAKMDALPPKERDYAASIFHYLVTPSGTKIAHTVSDLAKYADLPEEQLTPMLEKLSRGDMRILRPVAPPSDKPAVPRYEIFHDVLAPAILDWRARYVVAQELAEAEKQAARRAAEQEKEAVRQRELTQAQALAAAEAARAEEAEARRKAEVERAEEARQSMRRARQLSAALIVSLIFAVIAAGFAYQQSRRTDQKARLATSRALAAHSVNDLTIDPERSILLALHAATETYSADKTVTSEVEDALHRAVQASRVSSTIYGHADWVLGVAFSPDGARLATVSRDGTAKVWDAASGKELFTLSGHTDAVWGIAFSPDGARLATASADKTAKAWDAASGKDLFTLSGHTAGVYGIAFSPDGTRLATASEDKTAKVWDAASGKELLTLSAHTAEVWGIAFSPDGKRLATASLDKTAKVWDAASGKDLFTLSGHTDGVYGIAFSPDGARLATASADKTAKVWDAASGKELLTLSAHIDAVWGIAFSPDGARLATVSRDGARLATVSRDGTAKVWDAASGKELFTLSGHTDEVWGIAFSPDGKRLATASFDKTAKVWDAAPGKELLTLSGHTNTVYGIAFSPDGTRLATASLDKTARVWDAASGEELLILSGHTNTVYGIAFSPDGEHVATASFDKTAKMWDAASGKELLTLSGHTDQVWGIAFSPDGKRLATASWDRTAKVWDAASGKELFTLSGHTDAVQGVAFSPDGTRLATASRDRTAKVWDAASGKELLTLSGHTNTVHGIAFSPDGMRLATGSGDRTAKVWDAGSGKELLTLSGHTTGVWGIAFSPDGTRLATASWDKTAKVWDAASGKELLTLSGHAEAVQGVAFSLDGARLAAVSSDKMVQVYTLDINELMALARARLTRSLTPKECEKYLRSEPCPSAVKALDSFVKGKNLAKAGDVKSAVASFQEALKLDPTLGVDPEAEAQRWAATGLVAAGVRFVTQGSVKEAMRAYTEAQRLDPTVKISFGEWNALCWFGSLWGHATDVMYACDKAVALAPDNGYIRDSRGVGRALSGDYKGAIEDFEAYLKQTYADPMLEQRKPQRQRWVDALRKDKNPFTEQEIKKLFNE